MIVRTSHVNVTCISINKFTTTARYGLLMGVTFDAKSALITSRDGNTLDSVSSG